MATVIDHPLASVTPPPAAVTRVLSRFGREQLAAFISVAIDLLDIADGDPDLENATNLEDDFVLTGRAKFDAGAGPGCPVSDVGELAGDEQDGTGAEDDCMAHAASGPGCPVSDPGGCEHDGLEIEEGRAPDGARKSREAHTRRIRRDRCRPILRQGRVSFYQLKDEGGRSPRLSSRYRRRKRRS